MALLDFLTGANEVKKAGKTAQKGYNQALGTLGYNPTGAPLMTKSQFKAAGGKKAFGGGYGKYKANALATAAQSASAPGAAIGPGGGTTVTPATGGTPGYLPVAQALFDEQKRAVTDAEARARGDLTTAGTQQQNVLRSALDDQIAAIVAGEGKQAAALQPYADYGAGAIPLMEGGFGESPESAADFMTRYENSPLYQAQLQASMELANRGLERAGAASSGLNNGGLIRESLREGNLLGRKNIGDYYGLLDNRLRTGLDSASRLSDIYGTGTGLRTSAYGDYGGRSASAYGTTGANLADNTSNALARALQSGQLYSGNVGNAYQQIQNAQIGGAGAKAAGQIGAANTNANFLQGAMNLGGNIFGAGGIFGGPSTNTPPWWAGASSAVQNKIFG